MSFEKPHTTIAIPGDIVTITDRKRPYEALVLTNVGSMRKAYAIDASKHLHQITIGDNCVVTDNINCRMGAPNYLRTCMNGIREHVPMRATSDGMPVTPWNNPIRLGDTLVIDNGANMGEYLVIATNADKIFAMNRTRVVVCNRESALIVGANPAIRKKINGLTKMLK